MVVPGVPGNRKFLSPIIVLLSPFLEVWNGIVVPGSRELLTSCLPS